MTNLPDYLSDSAQVDSAAIKPLPSSRKIYVQGSRPDLRVPMREITVQDTPTEMGGEKNPPVVVYDTSGPYTDPDAALDPARGIARLRAPWIAERGAGATQMGCARAGVIQTTRPATGSFSSSSSSRSNMNTSLPSS